MSQFQPHHSCTICPQFSLSKENIKNRKSKISKLAMSSKRKADSPSRVFIYFNVHTGRHPYKMQLSHSGGCCKSICWESNTLRMVTSNLLQYNYSPHDESSKQMERETDMIYFIPCTKIFVQQRHGNQTNMVNFIITTAYAQYITFFLINITNPFTQKFCIKVCNQWDSQ